MQKCDCNREKIKKKKLAIDWFFIWIRHRRCCHRSCASLKTAVGNDFHFSERLAGVFSLFVYLVLVGKIEQIRHKNRKKIKRLCLCWALQKIKKYNYHCANFSLFLYSSFVIVHRTTKAPLQIIWIKCEEKAVYGFASIDDFAYPFEFFQRRNRKWMNFF